MDTARKDARPCISLRKGKGIFTMWQNKHSIII